MEYRQLGKSGIKVPAIGIGAWQWGSREWGWGSSYGKQDLLEAFKTALEVGLTFIDTAELYGRGKSEKLIGEALRGHREEAIIATKVSAWNLSYGRLLRSAERSLSRLGVDAIDLYQVHFPNPIVPIARTMKAMKKLVNDGKIRSVGVSNFGLKRLIDAQKALEPLELASNQVKYNLLDRHVEKDLLSYSTNHKVTIIAYSPLAQGLLTGKYAPSLRPTSLVQRMNTRFSSRNLARLGDLNQVIGGIATAHAKTHSQVVLNWLIGHENVVAIPGVKTAQHVLDDAGAADWRLDAIEVAKLEKAGTGLGFDRVRAVPHIIGALIRR